MATPLVIWASHPIDSLRFSPQAEGEPGELRFRPKAELSNPNCALLPIAGIIAHEWGHHAQFTCGWMNPQASTVRLTELEADAFSGYYRALAKGWAGFQMNTYFQLLHSLGTYDFTNSNFHGTPNERVASGGLGMQLRRRP